MDVQTGLIYVTVVVASVLVIGFIYIFAMKEKSYEEAIAEQRKLPDDLLLGKKEKGKEKKHKNKTGKKVKEKKEEKEDKEEKPEHVQFEETPQILPSEPPVQRENLHQITHSEPAVNKSPKETPTKSKKNAKDKDSRSKRDEQQQQQHKDEKKELPVANNQQQQPSPQIAKETTKEVKPAKEEKEKQPKEEKIEKVTVASQQQSSSSAPRKVKKKNDILAQIGGDRDGVNFTLLNPLIQKAELSRTEIQFLIDQLLNKQQDNPQEHAEWTESRADPVIKLKKQLAEKEQSLKNEQEASISVQNKLLELRAELNSERSRLRQMEEALNAKVTEAQTLHTRMQHILETHAAEKQGFARQIEQLQTKVNEDAAIIVKMQEDQGQTHGQMQQELIAQRKNLEVQFATMRETENQLKAQLSQKCVELQELQNVNVTMSQELQATCESSTHEIEVLRGQLAMMQEQLMHAEGQLQHYKEASDRLQDMHRQLEESRRAQSDMDHRIKNMHRHEQELQKQASWLQSELDAAKAQADEALAELEKVKSDSTDSANDNGNAVDSAQLKAKEEELQKALGELNAAKAELQKKQNEDKKLQVEVTDSKNQLKTIKSELARSVDNYKLSQNDLKKCQDELRSMQQILAQTQSEMSKLHGPTAMKSGEADLQIMRLQEETERLAAQVGNLREKNDSLTSQLEATKQRPAAEGRENGIEDKAQKNTIEVVESTNLLAQKEGQIVELRTALSQKEKELDQLGTQVESLRSEVNNQHSLTSRLQDDLEQQRTKNNDDVHKLKEQEQEATKALLQRIFPEIKVSGKSHDQWMKSFEDQVYAVLNKIKNDTKSDESGVELEKTNKNLQSMVNHYKQIIYDTEGMLNKLQSHVESEEKRWQAQLRQKESEVTNLRVEIQDLQNKTSSNSELQQKISELEARLSESESVKGKESKSQSTGRLSDFTVLEQLQEEKARLSQQLHTESSKLSGLNAEVTKLRLLVETSESSLATEKKLVLQLQKEIAQFKSEVCGSSSNSDQSALNGPPAADSPISEGGSGKK